MGGAVPDLPGQHSDRKVTGAPGALARGDAAVNLRFPHAGYREKIWDHAAGALIVTEAGAAISDAAGALPCSLRLRHGSAQSSALCQRMQDHRECMQ